MTSRHLASRRRIFVLRPWHRRIEPNSAESVFLLVSPNAQTGAAIGTMKDGRVAENVDFAGSRLESTVRSVHRVATPSLKIVDESDVWHRRVDLVEHSDRANPANECNDHQLPRR